MVSLFFGSGHPNLMLRFPSPDWSIFMENFHVKFSLISTVEEIAASLDKGEQTDFMDFFESIRFGFAPAPPKLMKLRYYGKPYTRCS